MAKGVWLACGSANDGHLTGEGEELIRPVNLNRVRAGVSAIRVTNRLNRRSHISTMRRLGVNDRFSDSGEFARFTDHDGESNKEKRHIKYI